MKAFIDCGFYSGGAINMFKTTQEYSEDFEYYGFDPMLNMDKMKVKWPTVKLYKQAIWIADDQLEFHVSGRHGGRANGFSHNPRAGKEQILKVDSIHFSKWLEVNFKPDDYIVIKLDIEGAEYEVVSDMIKSGAINYVNVLYLEFHPKRAGDISGSRSVEIVQQLSKVPGLIVRKSMERYLRSLKRSKR